MTIVFKYRKEKGLFGVVHRPVADIDIMKVNGKWVEFHPYIDSGADISIIPYTFGLYLGFKAPSDKIYELRGASVFPVPIEIRKVKMRIGNVELEARVAWALIEEATPLLGRLDIFDKFNITFKEREGKIIFEPVE